MFPKLYPHLKGLLQLDASAKGTFPGARPTGVTVHYSADRDIDRFVRTLVERGLGYHLMIDRNGDIIQMTSFDRKVWHAGRSVWAGQRPNHSHIAVAIASWGYLEQLEPHEFQSWAKVKIPKEDVAFRPDSIKGVVKPWDSATLSQIASLFEILRFFTAQGISASDICGHDEAALPPGRKSDPGGVLPMSMDQIRRALAHDAAIV